MARRVLIGAIGLGLTLAACGGADTGGAIDGTPTDLPTSAANEVSVELKEYAVTPTPASAPAGQVIFSASNAGTIEHELVVIATDLAPADLPVRDGKVDESGDGVEVAGEIGEFAAGTTETGIFTLDAGSYVLICNVVGHYQLEMRAGFSVDG